MSWTFSIPISLLFFFPGICSLLGVRLGASGTSISPFPDKFRSTESIFILIIGTIVGHFVGSLLLWLVSIWCMFGPCLSISYEPNIYKWYLANDKHHPGSIFYPLFFISLLLIGTITGLIFYFLVKRKKLIKILSPISQGWVSQIIEDADNKNKLAIAYVLTKLNFDNRFLAYEGIVKQITLDEDQKISMIVLEDADRFLVEIMKTKVKRIVNESHPIPYIQITSDEINNVAFEIVDLPDKN